MRVKLLHQYMAKEILYPFLFGVVAFSTITAGGAIIPGLINDARAYNLGFNQVIALFFLRTPQIISYTFPMSTLLAALLCFSRLSGESELAAFRAGGISLYKLMVAPLIFGILISFITIFFNEAIIPKASFIEENTIIQLKDTSKSAPTVKKNVSIPKYEDGYLTRLLYAHEMTGSTMHEVSVSEYDQGRLARIIFAQEAEWQPAGGWEFRKGTLHQFGGNKRTAFVVDFEKETVNINVNPRDISGRSKDPQQMDLFELSKYIQQQQSFGAETTELRVKWHQKIAIPFACLIFVLLGAPMGIRPQRSSSSVGLGISILVIFLYYVLLSVGMWFGMMGVLLPVLAAWLPNILIGGYGLYNLYQKANV
jgi:lipopolysaccharide export system permease protein